MEVLRWVSNARWECEPRAWRILEWWSRKSRRKGSEKSIWERRVFALWKSGGVLEGMRGVVLMFGTFHAIEY